MAALSPARVIVRLSFEPHGRPELLSLGSTELVPRGV